MKSLEQAVDNCNKIGKNIFDVVSKNKGRNLIIRTAAQLLVFENQLQRNHTIDGNSNFFIITTNNPQPVDMKNNAMETLNRGADYDLISAD